MKNNTTLARPYARAVFEIAKEDKALDEWLDQLALLSEVVKNSDVAQVLDDPRLTEDQKIEILEAICQGKLGKQQNRFLHLLEESDRLSILGEVYELFSTYKAEFERVIDVRLTTAVPIDADVQRRFSEVLTKRLGRQVDLVCDMDPTIMGGAIVRAGDQVIDGSVKSRLERLAETLIA